MRELFEHTADLGLRVRAAELDTLFAEAAACLFSAIVEDLSTIRLEVAQTIELTGTDREYLLFDWLRELLYRFDAEHMLFCSFNVKLIGTELIGFAYGEPLDPERHVLSHEVKAITYHELKVEETPEGWLAEVIVDI